MNTEYKKDLRHNYMVISDYEGKETEPYSIKMLKYQAIEGVLPIEQRIFDNKILLYYDITAKQSMSMIYEKVSLAKDKVLKLCTGIIDTLENSYEYLLPEDDFILEPEYIYVEVSSGNPNLCFLPGYSRGIKEQMSSLLEYLMNKVDYNDREAVLLVYRLYAISREEGYTFEHLRKELREGLESYKDSLDVKKGKAQSSFHSPETQKVNDLQRPERAPESDNYAKIFPKKEVSSQIGGYSDPRKSVPPPQTNNDRRIPVMLEKLEREVELSCYPVITYIYAGLCTAAGIVLIICCLVSKLLYNTYGNRIDSVKLAALLLIVFCVEGYLMKIIWDKKNRITRIITRNDYADPRQEESQLGKKSFLNKNGCNIREVQKAGEVKKSQGKEEEWNSFRQRRMRDQNDTNLSNNDCEKLKFVGGGASDGISSDVYSNTSGYWNQISSQDKYSDKKGYNSDIENNCVKSEYDDNPTCLLNSSIDEDSNESIQQFKTECLLKAVDEKLYQSIPITDFPFFIGKLKKNVDYCLEKEGISRYHAKITKEDGRYYITDLNSTNGTFLNGEALPTYEKKEVKEKDEIAFADIKYCFNITDGDK